MQFEFCTDFLVGRRGQRKGVKARLLPVVLLQRDEIMGQFKENAIFGLTTTLASLCGLKSS